VINIQHLCGILIDYIDFNSIGWWIEGKIGLQLPSEAGRWVDQSNNVNDDDDDDDDDNNRD